MYVPPNSRNDRSYSAVPTKFRDSARSVIVSQLPYLQNSAYNYNNAESSRNVLRRFDSRNSTASTISNQSSIFSSSSANSHGSYSSHSSYGSNSSGDRTATESLSLHELNQKTAHNENVSRYQDQTLSSVGLSELLKMIEEEHLSYNLNLTKYIKEETLIDWKLNHTRSQLIVSRLPIVCNNKIPKILSSPNDISGLALLVIEDNITDSNLILKLINSDIYIEHSLDYKFRRSAAEVSVKKSRLLQLNSKNLNTPLNLNKNQYESLFFENKKIAIKNFILNLAIAATTKYEFKILCRDFKRNKRIKYKDNTLKLSIEEKKKLWDQISTQVYNSSGLNLSHD